MIQFTEFLFITELFRHLWFNECMLLAKAYRSLPRPYVQRSSLVIHYLA